MPSLKIEVQLDNAAFTGEELAPSIATALHDLAERVREQSRDYLKRHYEHNGFFAVRDTNGNTCGKLTFDFSDEEEGDND